MYQDYFGFRDQPFSIAPDPRYLFMSRQHKEALAHLFYGVRNSGGFVLLTGEVGTGKTTVCRCLLEQLPDNVLVAFILNPRLTGVELLACICDEFRITHSQAPVTVKTLIDRINAFLLKAHAAGKNPVLIIDEAQNLSPEVLEQLRLLTNLETNRKKLLQIILLGQPELRDMLSQKELRQLAQRITARFHLGPLCRHDVTAYVRHRLLTAGVERPLFTSGALKTLFRMTGGVPRLINVICDRALLGVSCEGASMVSVPILKRAAREVQGEGAGSRGPGLLVSRAFLVLLLVACLGFAGWQFLPGFQPLPVSPTPVPEKNVAPDVIAPTEETSSAESGFSEWVMENFSSLSKAEAFRAMLDVWQLDYRPEQEPLACGYAESQGLQCLHGRGSLGMLKKIDRPAVLTLLAPDGSSFYLTLSEVVDSRLLLIGDQQEHLVDVSELENFWLGEFSLVWRPPKGYQAVLKPGQQGSLIVWLDQQLGRVAGLGYQPSGSSRYDGLLLEAAKSFQTSAGLEDDGIVGPQTLIQLNTASGIEGPRLMRGGRLR
jgi:general secretion pathway protein A